MVSPGSSVRHTNSRNNTNHIKIIMKTTKIMMKKIEILKITSIISIIINYNNNKNNNNSNSNTVLHIIH